VNRYNYTQSILLAFLALLAVFTAKTADSRLFHRVLALYLFIGVPIGIATNHVLIYLLRVPSASALFVTGDLCLLVYVIAVPCMRSTVAPKEPSRALFSLRLGAAAFLPTLAILVSMLLAVAGHHPMLGVVASILSMVLYGVRSTYAQMRLFSLQWRLQSANEQLEDLSQRDPLTGCYNRRWFSEQFELEWIRRQRSHEPLAILMIDVDHFKLFNDTRGHADGDVCLQAVAKALDGALYRSTDALVRYGGEEFVAMLPNTDMEGLGRVAGKMMGVLDELQFEHPASPFGVVTVSIGGVVWKGSGGSMPQEQMLVMADKALYEAKRDGRNCVRLWSYLSEEVSY
jgi:diguanylate cyclase (GGDEF)-like protein